MTPVSWSFTTGDHRPATCPLGPTRRRPPIAVRSDSQRRSKLGHEVRQRRRRLRSPASASTRAPGNTGTHVGHLWTAAGTLLATATFTAETATGWQQVAFATPVAITANTTYVVSYYAPSGRYAVDAGYFSTAGVDSGPLHALSSGGQRRQRGVPLRRRRRLPHETYNATNYWVDVVFRPTAGASTAITSSAAGTASVDRSGPELQAQGAKPSSCWTSSRRPGR